VPSAISPRCVPTKRLAAMLAWCVLSWAAIGAGPVARAAAGAPFELPPIGDSSAEHHPGKIIWADLVTPDLAAAEQFYGGLFGWTFRSIHAGEADYAIAMLGGRPVGGLLQRPVPSGEHRQSAWLTFIAVRDIEAARKLALAQGAKSLTPVKTYGGRGAQEVFTDPDGAVFAALASSSGDSGDYLAAPGEWIWSSLLTTDPAHSASFYKAVFGYEVFDLDGDGQHFVLAADDYARAGIHPLQPGHRHPHWLNFVRVADTAAATARAVALGGRVLVEPHSDRHGGQVAVLADPLGAPFGVMEWTEADSKAEPQ
jgi:uncharacterized protein